MAYERWDPETLPEHFIMAIMARRRSGKSVFIKHLCYTQFRYEFPRIVVFTDTLYNQFYQDFAPKIVEGFDPVKIHQIVEQQKSYVRHREKNENISILLILDDILSVKYQESLLRLCTQGRHLHISVIMALQDPTLISREMRDQLDVVATFKQPGLITRERMADTYLSSTTRREGDQLIKELTQGEYAMMVIDSCCPSYNTKDYVFTYKVDKLAPKTFPMGPKKKFAWMYED